MKQWETYQPCGLIPPHFHRFFPSSSPDKAFPSQRSSTLPSSPSIWPSFEIMDFQMALAHLSSADTVSAPLIPGGPLGRHVQVIFFLSGNETWPENQQAVAQVLQAFKALSPSVRQCFTAEPLVRYLDLAAAGRADGHVMGSMYMFEELLIPPGSDKLVTVAVAVPGEEKRGAKEGDDGAETRGTKEQGKKKRAAAASASADTSAANTTNTNTAAASPLLTFQRRVRNNAVGALRLGPEAIYGLYMEPDMRAAQGNWLMAVDAATRLPNEPFWIKGSIFRGTPQSIGPRDPIQNYIHINGNAIYNLHDPAFGRFYFQRMRKAIGVEGGYDADFFLYLLGDRKRFYSDRVQDHAHRFHFTELIANLWNTSYSLREYTVQNPWTVLVHGGSPS